MAARHRRSDGRESKWDVFDRLVQELNGLDFSVLTEAENSTKVGEKRKILTDAGLNDADEVDSRYLVSAINKVYTNRVENEKPEPVKWTDLLSYGGIGRYLICYMDENPSDGWVVKIPNSLSSLRYIDLYALNGTELARQRLGNGEAALSLIIDVREEGAPFQFKTVERGYLEYDVAIVQQKIYPFVDYLKRLCRKGGRTEDVDHAIGYIGKLKKLILDIYKQGIVDIDTFNIAGNYGIRKATDSVTIFDLGDLSTEASEAAKFIRNLDSFNGLLEDGLLEVDGTTIDERISDFFSKHPLRQDDFHVNGDDLFGTAFDVAKSRMEFPYSEEQTRNLFYKKELHARRG